MQEFKAVRHEFHAKQIGEFTIIADVGEYHVDYRCHECIGAGRGESGKFDLPLFSNKNDPFGDHVESIDEAASMVTGSIKWDGCANLKLFPDGLEYVHFCGMRDIRKFTGLLSHLYSLTAMLLPTFDSELADMGSADSIGTSGS